MEKYIKLRARFLSRERMLRGICGWSRWISCMFIAGLIMCNFFSYYGSYPISELILESLVLAAVLPKYLWRLLGDGVSLLMCSGVRNQMRAAYELMPDEELSRALNAANYRYAWDQAYHSVLWKWSNATFTIHSKDGLPLLKRAPGLIYTPDVFDTFAEDSWETGKRYSFDSGVEFIADDLHIQSSGLLFEASWSRFGVEHHLLYKGNLVGLMMFHDLTKYNITQLGDIYYNDIHANCLFISESWYR